MLIYEITETERQQIMQALEWAMWGIKENLAADYLTPETRQSIEDEKQDLVRLWDRINQMQPTDSSF